MESAKAQKLHWTGKEICWSASSPYFFPGMITDTVRLSRAGWGRRAVKGELTVGVKPVLWAIHSNNLLYTLCHRRCHNVALLQLYQTGSRLQGKQGSVPD